MKSIKDFKIIDSHCHIFPEKIAKKATDSTDIFYGITANGTSHPSDYIGDVQTLLDQMSKTGVYKCLVTSVATNPAQVKSINEFIAREVSLHPDNFIGFGAMHPESQNIEQDLEHLTELGLKGIKIHPDIQGFKLDHSGFLEIFRLAEQKRLPVLIHTGDNRYDNSNPDRVIKVLEMFENLTVIGAHFGGWSIWEEASKRLCRYKNFYVDCSSSFYALTKEAAEKIIRTYGTDKVLFGSDFPMWRQDSELEFLFSLNLSEKELEDILHNNITKLLKL